MAGLANFPLICSFNKMVFFSVFAPHCHFMHVCQQIDANKVDQLLVLGVKQV